MIKSTMGYNQRQIAILGVAKDWGDAIGFVAGSLCDVLPTWGLLLIGAVQNFLGYGLLWLIVTQKLPNMPLWVVSFDCGVFFFFRFYCLFCFASYLLFFFRKVCVLHLVSDTDISLSLFLFHLGFMFTVLC